MTNGNLTSNKDVFILKTDNMAVISFKFNSSNETARGNSNGFSQDDRRDIDIVTDPNTVNYSTIESAAFITNDVLVNASSNASSVVSFAVYDKSTMFDVNSSRLQYEDHSCDDVYDNQIITSVISVNTNNKIVSEKNFVLTLFRTNPTVNKCGIASAANGKKFTCVFWDYTSNEWNSSGCSYSSSREGLHSCECNHLTNFAVLMVCTSVSI